MNWNNITAHWKTSVAGVLIAILAITPILQKFNWSKPDASSIFGLVASVAAALLGLVSKDPNS